MTAVSNLSISWRQEALTLLKSYNKESFHLLHAFTVEGIMRWFAKELGYEEDIDFWGIEGLIGAAARMRPSKSCCDMEISSLKKKFKDKKFAAGCSRDTICQGARMLGWELDELLEKTLSAMKACEEQIQQEGC